MDTFTQAVLGAAVGQAAEAHRLGRRALLWGAVGGLLPDADLLWATPGTLAEFELHRGFTHALWFGPVVGSALGLLSWWLDRRDGVAAPRRAWIRLWVLALFTHPLLDVFTSYGTQLLAPFSRQRFAIDAVPIIDPVYTLILLAALAVGWRHVAIAPKARTVAAIALMASSSYVLLGWGLNEVATRRARAQIGPGARVDVYPTLLQPWVRRVVARREDEVMVGLIRVPGTKPVRWQTFSPARGRIVVATHATPEGLLLEWFAIGQVTASVVRLDEGRVAVELDDLRYGFAGDPRHGLWGIRAIYGPDGRRIGRPERIDRAPRGSRAAQIGALWRVLTAGSATM